MVSLDNYIDQIDDEGVLNLAKYYQLPKHPLAVSGVFKQICNPLDGHSLSSCKLHCLDNLTIAALAQELLQQIFLTNFPILELLVLFGRSTKESHASCSCSLDSLIGAPGIATCLLTLLLLGGIS